MHATQEQLTMCILIPPQSTQFEFIAIHALTLLSLPFNNHIKIGILCILLIIFLIFSLKLKHQPYYNEN